MHTWNTEDPCHFFAILVATRIIVRFGSLNAGLKFTKCVSFYLNYCKNI